MKRLMIAAFAGALSLAGPAGAADILKLTLSGTIDNQIDFQTGAPEPLPIPAPFTITAWVELDSYFISDSGSSTGVLYPAGSARIDDPFLPFVGADPFGSGLTNLAASGLASANVQDIPPTFYENFGIVQSVGSNSGDTSWNYRSEIFIKLIGPPKAGDGTDDNPMTPTALLDFLDRRLGDPTVTFSSSWLISSPGASFDDPPNISAGKLWRSDQMTLLSYQLVSPSAVPEPASWLLMTIGIGAIGATLRRRSVVRAGAC